jgi:N-acetylneuraminate synthase
MKKTFLIAEIGINHNGSVHLAKKLITKAKEAGFDAVKFQKREPNICVPNEKKNEIRDTPWGKITYLNYKKKIEFGKKEFDIIDRFCKKIKIIWFASPWDIESNKFLKKYKLRYQKIASPMLTNYKLITEMAKENKIFLISTGMSNFKTIDKVVNIFKKKKRKFYLLHCVSNYPCDIEDLNLSLIKKLKKRYKCKIGYSGHETSVSPSLTAVAMGAEVVERHITLNRTMWGTDHSASLEMNGMIQLVNLIRKYEKSYGDGIKKITLNEKKKLNDMKYW